MARIVVPEADALLNQKIPVLDHGFVELVDYLGGDRRIAEAAWVSSADEVAAAERTDAAVRRIIDYMMRNSHSSPFEQVALTFRMKMPIFVARQIVRHRTAKLNEMSGRYRILPCEAYLPEESRLQGKGKANKQGSDGDLDDDMRCRLHSLVEGEQRAAFAAYEMYDASGLANELCRINLPLATYTEWMWQMDLGNLFKFLKLRLDAHAQWETRQYAEAMAPMVRAVAPMAYEAFEEHVLHAVTLSREEAFRLSLILTGEATAGVDTLALARKLRGAVK